MTPRDSLSPDLSVADRLDDEIAKLRAQVESLKDELKLQTTTILASDSTRSILQHQEEDDFGIDAATKSSLLAQSDKQAAHLQQSLYRTCASVTTLKIRDPDPHAVDEGNVLGLRFEVMSRSRFIRPYYVMLNRPYPNSRHLRVHRHTLPPCIPLAGLAARFLPAPKSDESESDAKQQDLSHFARTLRRELVRYQNRITSISDLRKAVGLGSHKGKIKETGTVITDISAVDAEAKQIRLEWEDGRTGRLVMDDDGKILKMVAQNGNERDRDGVRELLGGISNIEELIRRRDPVHDTA
ncbi:cenp-O kinetochore centromere component [Truncatella angustata]|uniref:Cenp-O kinetochore centromere component n=1 Tax=Truncatella angustata TaxID=152316 RepID=A0A9P8UD31_9PEZI|nr:cenp-O kinetochore centromere component [Truncatella angustata]KAH6647045.1 cenp-O kinetochore centromere component [Truncatella angustata]